MHQLIKIKLFILVLFIVLAIHKNSYGQWTEVYSDTSHWVNDIYCLNNNTCWVSGSNGLFIKTINGGLNWNTIAMDTSKNYGGIYFIDDSTGYMITGENSILRSFDGGSTWIEHLPPTSCMNLILEGSHAFNKDTALFFGSCNFSDLIYLTYDGGITIIDDTLVPPCGHAGYFIHDILFINDSVGFLTGDDESLYKTYNRGEDWVKIHEDCISGFDINILSMSCYNDSICWFGGNRPNSPNGLKYSIDGGYNWNTYQTTVFYFVWDVAFFFDGIGYIITGDNNIYKTTDFGLTFQFQFHIPPQPNIPNIELRKFFFLNSQNGYAISTHSVLKTTNGGGPVGLGENQASEIIKIFPNPSNGEFTINKFPLFPGAWHVQVFDNMGKLVFQKQNIPDKEININLSEHAGGLYFVKAIFGNKSSSGKVVIMK